MRAVAAEAGVSIADGDRHILLKWHKLRRSADEPPFLPGNLALGLAAGASLEIDARVLKDGNWVCLHDDVLDNETDGRGPVAAADTATIRGLRIAGGSHAPPLLADLARTVAEAHGTAARLQIDLKEPLAGLTPAAVDRFVAIVAPAARHCLLSGTDWEAVRRLGAAAPDLALGFDPLDLAEGRRLDGGEAIAAFLDEVAARAPEAATFYLYYRFVLAALDAGINPVARLKARGATIDVWTLDPTTRGIGAILPRVVRAGADQITTNDPLAMARLWQDVPVSDGRNRGKTITDTVL